MAAGDQDNFTRSLEELKAVAGDANIGWHDTGNRSPLTDLLKKINTPVDFYSESLADSIIKEPVPATTPGVMFKSPYRNLKVLVCVIDGTPEYVLFNNGYHCAYSQRVIDVLDKCEGCERVKKEEVPMGPNVYDPVKIVLEVEKAKKEYAELPKYDPKNYTAPRDEKKNLTGYVETVCKKCGIVSVHTLKHVSKFTRGYGPDEIVLKGGAMLDHCLLCGHDVAYRLDKEATLE